MAPLFQIHGYLPRQMLQLLLLKLLIGKNI